MADDKKKETEDVKEDKPKQDETIPGGKYKVGGIFVDSEGKELGKK